MRHTALCLQPRSSGKWVKHTFLSNNTSLIADHFHDLVRLHSHQQRTVLEFTWTLLQTTLFKQTRVRFTGAHPRSEDSIHIIQTNRTLTSIEPGCAPKVLVWKHPKALLCRSWAQTTNSSVCYEAARSRTKRVKAAQSMIYPQVLAAALVL